MSYCRIILILWWDYNSWIIDVVLEAIFKLLSWCLIPELSLVRGGYMGGCGVSANVNFLLATTFCSSNLWSYEVLESSIAIFLEVLFFETRYNGLRYWKVELFSNNLRKVNYSSEWDCYMNISKFALCTIHFWEGSWHGLSPNFLLF